VFSALKYLRGLSIGANKADQSHLVSEVTNYGRSGSENGLVLEQFEWFIKIALSPD
jgi:hypothetical protein